MALDSFIYSNEKSNIVRKYIVPKRIMLSKDVLNEELLLQDTPKQAYLGNSKVCTMKRGGFVLLDFGCELQGGIDLTVQWVKEVSGGGHVGKMRIVFGESVSEALSQIGQDGAQNDHSVRDMTVDVTILSDMRFGNTGFRFVKLEAVDGDMILGGVKGVLEYRDIEYKGSFCCNDERLNKIFDTAAYTVHLNMQDYIWDGIKRDRLVWIGDINPELATICSVFGFDECVEKSLDLSRNSVPLDGENPDRLWMSFPSYSCWWIINHRDWYMQNGRLDYLLEQKEYMYKLCNNLLCRIHEDGSLDFDGKYFVDWSSNNTPFMEAGFRGCLILGLEAASEIFCVYGDEEMKNRCIDAVKNVKKVVPEYSGNKQVAAITSLSGLCDSRKINDIICNNLTDGLSTFYGYYVLEALAKAGNVQSAVDVMKDFWGGMLDLGATTFWEDFDIKWLDNAGRIDELPSSDRVDVHVNYGKFCYTKLRHSLCHGWASGPAPFISKHILGVKILEPGCKKIKISPCLCNLEWVKGTYPTPYGSVEIEHRMQDDGKILTKINAPKEIEIIQD